MKQVFIRNGAAHVEEVPAPSPADGEVLVRVRNSCISVGTEMSGIRASSDPLWMRAVKHPDKVVKAFNMMATKGVQETLNIVRGQVGTGLVVGYSAAGEVIELGRGVEDLAVGDRVACAGAQSAHHAEIIRVPRNLVAPMPKGVTFEGAATVTMGAIALQGLRRADPTLGETFVVLGLGLLGQITVQLLKANGCCVIGIDPDAARVDRAEKLGLDLGLMPSSEPLTSRIGILTHGIGADGVVVTAASPDPAALALGFKLCRRKGRVVLVGDVPIQIDREDIYRKEIDFRISTSYGPGRYDRRYEEEGLDYPVGYVRWTENRNMQAYLALVEQGKVTPSALVDSEFPVEDAGAAYEALKGGTRPLAVLLSYPPRQDEEAVRRRRVGCGAAVPAREGAIRVGLAGTGAFAQSVHLPNLSAMKDLFHLRAVMSRTAHAAQGVAKVQRADYATTDYDELLSDKDLDLILISTRHDSHGDYALRALQSGKHVFVEKPLTLDPSDLHRLRAFYGSDPAGKPLLMTGFNRRFSPAVAKITQALRGRAGPMIVSYRMNAGHIPLDHWLHGAPGGGRNLGEACHIYDLFTALTGARMLAVEASAIAAVQGQYARNDNFVATVRFDDGSVCTLVYTALGDPSWPKEQMEVFCDGAVYALGDYKTLAVKGREGISWSGSQDKGHKQELNALGTALTRGGDWPIPLWQQIQATEIAFAVERALFRDLDPAVPD